MGGRAAGFEGPARRMDSPGVGAPVEVLPPGEEALPRRSDSPGVGVPGEVCLPVCLGTMGEDGSAAEGVEGAGIVVEEGSDNLPRDEEAISRLVQACLEEHFASEIEQPTAEDALAFICCKYEAMYVDAAHLEGYMEVVTNVLVAIFERELAAWHACRAERACGAGRSGLGGGLDGCGVDASEASADMFSKTTWCRAVIAYPYHIFNLSLHTMT